MTSSNVSIFRVTGPLCGEFTGHRWIARIKASDAELWCFLWSAPEYRVIWDAIALIHYDDIVMLFQVLPHLVAKWRGYYTALRWQIPLHRRHMSIVAFQISNHSTVHFTDCSTSKGIWKVRITIALRKESTSDWMSPLTKFSNAEIVSMALSCVPCCMSVRCYTIRLKQNCWHFINDIVNCICWKIIWYFYTNYIGFCS